MIDEAVREGVIQGQLQGNSYAMPSTVTRGELRDGVPMYTFDERSGVNIPAACLAEGNAIKDDPTHSSRAGHSHETESGGVGRRRGQNGNESRTTTSSSSTTNTTTTTTTTSHHNPTESKNNNTAVGVHTTSGDNNATTTSSNNSSGTKGAVRTSAVPDLEKTKETSQHHHNRPSAMQRAFYMLRHRRPMNGRSASHSRPNSSNTHDTGSSPSRAHNKSSSREGNRRLSQRKDATTMSQSLTSTQQTARSTSGSAQSRQGYPSRLHRPGSARSETSRGSHGQSTESALSLSYEIALDGDEAGEGAELPAGQGTTLPNSQAGAATSVLTNSAQNNGGPITSTTTINDRATAQAGSRRNQPSSSNNVPEDGEEETRNGAQWRRWGSRSEPTRPTTSTEAGATTTRTLGSRRDLLGLSSVEERGHNEGERGERTAVFGNERTTSASKTSREAGSRSRRKDGSGKAHASFSLGRLHRFFSRRSDFGHEYSFVYHNSSFEPQMSTLHRDRSLSQRRNSAHYGSMSSFHNHHNNNNNNANNNAGGLSRSGTFYRSLLGDLPSTRFTAAAAYPGVVMTGSGHSFVADPEAAANSSLYFTGSNNASVDNRVLMRGRMGGDGGNNSMSVVNGTPNSLMRLSMSGAMGPAALQDAHYSLYGYDSRSVSMQGIGGAGTSFIQPGQFFGLNTNVITPTAVANNINSMNGEAYNPGDQMLSHDVGGQGFGLPRRRLSRMSSLVPNALNIVDNIDEMASFGNRQQEQPLQEQEQQQQMVREPVTNGFSARGYVQRAHDVTALSRETAEFASAATDGAAASKADATGETQAQGERVQSRRPRLSSSLLLAPPKHDYRQSARHVKQPQEGEVDTTRMADKPQEETVSEAVAEQQDKAGPSSQHLFPVNKANAHVTHNDEKSPSSSSSSSSSRSNMNSVARDSRSSTNGITQQTQQDTPGATLTQPPTTATTVVDGNTVLQPTSGAAGRQRTAGENGAAEGQTQRSAASSRANSSASHSLATSDLEYGSASYSRSSTLHSMTSRASSASSIDRGTAVALKRKASRLKRASRQSSEEFAQATLAQTPSRSSRPGRRLSLRQQPQMQFDPLAAQSHVPAQLPASQMPPNPLSATEEWHRAGSRSRKLRAMHGVLDKVTITSPRSMKRRQERRAEEEQMARDGRMHDVAALTQSVTVWSAPSPRRMGLRPDTEADLTRSHSAQTDPQASLSKIHEVRLMPRSADAAMLRSVQGANDDNGASSDGGRMFMRTMQALQQQQQQQQQLSTSGKVANSAGLHPTLTGEVKEAPALTEAALTTTTTTTAVVGPGRGNDDNTNGASPAFPPASSHNESEPDAFAGRLMDSKESLLTLQQQPPARRRKPPTVAFIPLSISPERFNLMEAKLKEV